MIKTGRTIRPAALGEGVREDARSAHVAASSLTLPRPGEKRKDTCAAAPGFGRHGSFKVSRSQSPFHAVKRQVPRALLGLMEITPARASVLFPVATALMETFTHA